MTSDVKDRSGRGLPPKAERRALGKAAAEKRRRQRRNKQIRDRVLQILAPIAVVAVIVGAVWLFGGGGDEPESTASQPGSPSWMSSSFDQQLATKPAAVTPPTEAFAELKVTTLIQGTGAAVTSGQSVTVNYVGISRTTGEEFDSSWSRDQPFTFVIGSGGVIQGWSQGLLGVAVGSRVELDIPSELAYGDQGRVPGDLIFIVDVLSAS